MNIIKQIIKFIIDDIKQDIKFFKDISSGKAKAEDYTIDTKGFDIIRMLKNNWIFFLIVVLAFLCGYVFSSAHFQSQCVQFITENYIVPMEKEIALGVINSSLPFG